MDWQGIEWIVPIFELSMIVIPVYAFIEVRRRVKNGRTGRSRALLRYAVFAIAPVLVYILLYFLLVGFETLTRISVITEGLARSFFLLAGLGVAIGIVSIVAFVATRSFMKDP